MTHDELLDSAAAYALDALDEDERRAFEAHLPGCSACQEELDGFREAAALLALAVPAAPPPTAALRDRVAREALGVRPITAAASLRLVVGTGRGRWMRAPVFAVAASLIVAITGLFAWEREHGARSRLERDLARAQAAIAVRDSTISAFFGPEVHVVSLSEPAAAVRRKPSMRVYWNHTRHLFIVTAFEVPRAVPGKTYQLWAMRNGKPPLSMGTFDVDERGRAARILPVPASITDGGFIDDCALTLEPLGGSRQPTENPRLIGGWRHVD